MPFLEEKNIHKILIQWLLDWYSIDIDYTASENKRFNIEKKKHKTVNKIDFSV